MVGNFVLFNGDAPAEPLNAISKHKFDDLPLQMTVFNTLIPILMHFLTFNGYHFTHIASASCNVKPDVSQSVATFHTGVGFATVYRRIYCRRYPIRRLVTFVSALEFYFILYFFFNQ